MDDVQPVPEGVILKNYCVENTAAPDVVCTKTLTSGIELPNSVGDVVSQLKETVNSLKEVATNEDQLEEVASVPGLLLKDLPAALPWIARDIVRGKVRRWMIVSFSFTHSSGSWALMWCSFRHIWYMGLMA